MAATQKNRSIQIATPLEDDVLLFYKMQGKEALNTLFAYSLELLSIHADINPDKLLGENICVKLQMEDGGWRYFNGYVSGFGQYGSVNEFVFYRATVRPWLWFLTRMANCRIFQNKTVPDIIKEVFTDHGFSDFKEKLSNSYDSRENCVQYRETDFNFVSRLMEEEGITYFFSHEENRHNLVLVDDISFHDKHPGYAKIPYHIEASGLDRSRLDHIYVWGYGHEIQSGIYQLTDYDFKKPKANLLVQLELKESHAHAEYEYFDFPGRYTETSVGDQLVRYRIEELHDSFARAEGRCNARGLAVGYLFNLEEFPNKDQNKEYLVIAAEFSLLMNAYFAKSEVSGEEKLFDCSFTALDSKRPFRPACNSRKTLVHGAQTAIVVGPAGDEIYTDNYGRVKVQFHWDRYGKHNQDSSCWVRVSHAWAGKNWGMIAIPRIGQEVVVEFLEGDPDQPLIVGSVYNADTMPPYDLPANATQTGIKSRSSKGGGTANYNEFRFEDKKGAEMVLLHAEKDQTIEVEHDESHWVGHDRSKKVDHDETTTVLHDRSETVGNNETISIGVNRLETVGSNETITVGANRTRAVAINEAVAIGAAQEVVVGAAQAITVGAARTLAVGVDQSTNIGSNHSVSVGNDQSNQIGNNQTTQVGNDQSLTVAHNLSINAGDSITITTGKASISMKKDGTISISGKDITINGSGNINVKASSDVVIKGKNVLQN